MKAQQHQYIIHSFKCKNNFNTIGQVERRFESWEQGCFFQFCEIDSLAIFHKQSQPQVREDIRENQDPCYVLSKHGEFSSFSPKNMVTLYIVLIKKSFVHCSKNCITIFFVAKWEHLAPKRYPCWGSGKQQPTL